MQIKKSLILLIILSLSLSLVNAQKRQVIVHKEVSTGDASHNEVFIKHVGGHGLITDTSDVDVIVVGDGDVQFWNDSLHNKLIFMNEGDLAFSKDSLLTNVFIHKTPSHAKKVARIIIKKSGFFRKSKIIIDFDPRNQNILKVVDNDKEVPANKFHKYQEYLEDAADLSELEALHPTMQDFELQVELGKLPNIEVLEGLDSLIVILDGLESKHAIIKKERYKSLKHIVELETLAEELQGILTGAGITPPQKIREMSIKERKFYINGKEITGDVGGKCIQAYMEHSDLTPEDLDKKGEEISIHITFD